MATVRATFFGTSSLYLTDGTSGIFIDAFLTRPSLFKVLFGKIRPDIGHIRKALADGNVGAVDALFTGHSHHDHALDSAEVLKVTGGHLYGSESTLNIGRGAGLDEGRLHRIGDGDQLAFGAFSVRVFRGVHSPGDRYPGTIDRPLVPPAKASEYRTGGTFSFHITHPAGNVLIHPSANFVAGTFGGVEADVLYLGIGGLGAQDKQFQEDYWSNTVGAVHPARIYPIHWDNFGRALTRPLKPMPRVLDNFARTKAFLATRRGAPIVWQDALETVTLFQWETDPSD